MPKTTDIAPRCKQFTVCDTSITIT